MQWTLEEIRIAAARREVLLSSDAAGYLALAASDAMRRAPMGFRLADARLSPDGGVVLRVAESRAETGAEAIRAVLGALLRVTAPHVALSAVVSSKEADFSALVAQIENALVPLNRGAARRQLGRLAREMSRRFPDGIVPEEDEAESLEVELVELSSESARSAEPLDALPLIRRAPPTRAVTNAPRAVRDPSALIGGIREMLRRTAPAEVEPVVDTALVDEPVVDVAGTPTTFDALVAERALQGERERFPTLVPFAAVEEAAEEGTVRLDALLGAMVNLRAPTQDRSATENPLTPPLPTLAEATRASAPPKRSGAPGSRNSDVRELALAFQVRDGRDERQMARELKSLVGVDGSQTPPPVLVEESVGAPEGPAPQLWRLGLPAFVGLQIVALGLMASLGSTSEEAASASAPECRRSVGLTGAARDAEVRLVSTDQVGGVRVARGPDARFDDLSCTEGFALLVSGGGGNWLKLPVPAHVQGQELTELSVAPSPVAVAK